MSSRVLAFIALGGVLGAEARYGLSRLIPSSLWAIMLVNITGGLLMGVLMARLERSEQPHPLARPFFGVGILGGFTTFSTYSTDAYLLIDAGRVGAALGYMGLTLAGALLAVWAGSALVRR